MKTVQELAKQQYPDKPDAVMQFMQLHLRECFIEGYNARHQWQKVEPGWKPEGNERWYITDGQSACEAVYIHQVENWVDYTKARPVRVEFTPTHVMPFFFPELPNDQNTMQ